SKLNTGPTGRKPITKNKNKSTDSKGKEAWQKKEKGRKRS
ncbi:hypothetical protein LCGC14_2946090, partial [marine sediment metagenome]